MQRVPDAVRFQLAQCRPNGFRPGSLSCVHGKPQAMIRSASIYPAKQCRGCTSLIAAQTDANDWVTCLAQRERLVEHSLRGLDSKVPDRIEDPVERHSKVTLATLAAALQTFEQRTKLPTAPMNHADRDIYLRMQHILRVQLLHHAIGDKLVVVGSAQPLGHRLKCQQEASEVLVLIERVSFLFGENTSAVGDVGVAIVRGRKRSRMPPAQLRQRRRIDCALEVQM